MKILQIQTQSEAAGAQRISSIVGNYLSDRGHSITTAFLYRRSSAYDDDPNCVFMLNRPPGSLFDYIKCLWRLVRFSRKYAPQVIIAYQHYGNIAGVLASFLSGKTPVIANQNGMPESICIPKPAIMTDKIFGSMGCYRFNIVNSTTTENAFRNYPHSYLKRLIRIDHGVSAQSSELSKSEARKSFSLPENIQLIISTGRIAKEKNHIFLVDVLSRLDKSIHLAIAGDGPLFPEIMAHSKRLKVYDRVHLIGEIHPNRIGDFLKTGDVFAFPSLSETFGLSAVEAAISGTPLICNDIPALREVLSVAEENAAAFVSVNEVEPFAKKIMTLLENRKYRASQQKTQKKLAQKYCVLKMIDSYENCLNDSVS